MMSWTLEKNEEKGKLRAKTEKWKEKGSGQWTLTL